MEPGTGNRLGEERRALVVVGGRRGCISYIYICIYTGDDRFEIGREKMGEEEL